MDTHTRIIEATCKLLREDPGSLRMEDVAREANLSRQAVYLHFANRTALLEAATVHIEQELGFPERLRPIIEAETSLDTLDRFAEFLGDYLPVAQPVIEAFTPGRSNDPAIQAIFESRTANRRGGVGLVVGRLAGEQQLADDLDPSLAEELLMGLTSFELWRELTVVGTLTNEQYVEQLKRLMRRALLR